MARDADLLLGSAAGEHVRVAIWGRAHPGGLTISDGNWLCADLAVQAARSFRFRAFLRTKDFSSFAGGLRAMLAGDAPRARLMPRDPWLVVEIGERGGAWSGEVVARDHASVRVGAFAIHPSRDELESLATQVESMLTMYPVRS